MALQVEKTSKRGGRIIHEKEIMPPPSFDFMQKSNPLGQPTSPTLQKDEFKADVGSITELMKTPSKVVLLRVSNQHRVVDLVPFVDLFKVVIFLN